MASSSVFDSAFLSVGLERPFKTGQSEFFDSLSLFNIALLAILATSIIVALEQAPRDELYLGKVPWIGRHREWFSSIRSNIRSVSNMHRMAFDGYEKYSKAKVAFVIPSLQTGPVVMLPQAQVHEHLSMPEKVLDHKGPQNAFIHAKYTFADDRVTEKHVHQDVTGKQFTKQLPRHIENVCEELKAVSKELLPQGTDGCKKLNVSKTCMKINVRIACRAMVGLPLCRNKEFLEISESFALCIMGAGTIIDKVPVWLRPAAAYVVAAPARRNIGAAIKHLGPIIRERVLSLQQQPSRPKGEDEPDDFLQCLIVNAYKHNDYEERETSLIVRRLMMTLMAAVHSSSATITNAVLNIWGSKDSKDSVRGLREEGDRLVEVCGNKWTKTGLDQLFRTDSALKESIRFSPPILTAVPRRVVAPQGVTFSDGLNVPQGALVAFPIDPIHRDADFYPDPDKFDPFRFSRDLEPGGSSAPDSDQGGSGGPNRKALSMTTVSDRYFGFGQGRHACPGRFFAAAMLKLMIVHLVTTYDILEIRGRKEGTNIFGVTMPSSTATMMIRRRAP